MKAALLFLALFLLTSCERTSNVSETKTVGRTSSGLIIVERTVNGHDYINIIDGYTHSGTCRKCKQEKDSITSLIINTIKDGRTNNQR